MKEFKDKVAVITGAAGGIGFGLAERCAQEGMKVVLVDIDEKYLRKRTARKMEKIGANFITVVTDVSKASDMEALAERTLEEYGAVHILVNNAAIPHTKYAWNYSLKDWEWQIGVNLWGVIHGIRVFVPIMLKQDTEGHIVNTASMEGLISGSGPGGTIYGLCKHAIVSLTETLRTDFELKGSKLKASVLCPGFVLTRIFQGDIHRPKEFENDPGSIIEDTRAEDYTASFVEEDVLTQSPMMKPEEVAEITFQAIRDEKLYILTHKDALMKRIVKERFDEILTAFED
jgi:NAD(P)-dependent dehydrogenase (short-subunit alcohol dehydrogenase family)